MKKVLTACSFLIFLQASSQSSHRIYTTADAHSHNDYKQPIPFWEAWRNEFGSIEADIFLVNNNLLVAHDEKEIVATNTLDSLYLIPLQACIAKNHGQVYADTNRSLQLMIDVKTEGVSTLKKLVEKLRLYPSLIGCASLKITISGNSPDDSLFASFPDWIWFDGQIGKHYTPAALQKIAMLSDDFGKYSKWHGADSLPQGDRRIIETLIVKAHSLHKKVRFWGAPDDQNSWKTYMIMDVDYINTDHINDLAIYLNQFYKRQ